MQTVRITTSQNIDIDYELGGLGERIVARIIDSAIFILILIMATFVFSSINLHDVGGLITIFLFASLYVFYDLVCEIFMNGQSVGKKVMKIRVISADGAQPRLGQYIMRWLFRIVDFGIGGGAVALVSAAVTDKCQRVGDLVAGTILIKTESRIKSQHIAFQPADDNYVPVFEGASQLSEQDIELINEVINTYVKTGNSVVVYNMAVRIKDHLGVTPPAEMNDLRFLQTILKDYSHHTANTETMY